MSTNDFRDQLLTGSWGDLKVHLERDAIIIVSPELDLSNAALDVSTDNVTAIQSWIAKGLVGKPTAQQLAAWTAMPLKEFRFIIVQPYVLIQESGH